MQIIRKLSFYILSVLLLIFGLYGQDNVEDSKVELNSFIAVNIGPQMSGLKDEDFISSNYTPLFNVVYGKWISSQFAYQLGYKGFYFNAIADNFKHHYNYFYAEAVLNANNFIDPERISKSWNLLLHLGPGYFYNHTYGKPNVCLNIGAQNSFQITDKFQLNIDVAAIIGWDIYQGDEDILPSITVGLTYLFNID